MTPEERDIINDLFQRLRDFGVPEKDPQADALINQSVRALPDSAYLLVQTLLVREQELQQAEERVQELEDQIAQSQPAPAQAGTGGGSFLGGRGGQQSARGGSVPSMGGGSQDSATTSFGGGADLSPETLISIGLRFISFGSAIIVFSSLNERSLVSHKALPLL